MLVMKISVKPKHVPRVWPLLSTKAIKKSSQIDSIAVSNIVGRFFWPGFEAFVNPTVVSHLSDKLREKIKRFQNKIENQEVEIEAIPKVK